MSTSRKLEDIISNLDDMSETIEELKDQAEAEPIAVEKLDKLQADMTRASDRIEESLETGAAPAASQAAIAHNQSSQE